MTIKVVRIDPEPVKVLKRAYCSDCRAELEYDDDSINSSIHEVEGDWGHIQEYKYQFVTCPLCKQNIVTKIHVHIDWDDEDEDAGDSIYER